MFIHDHCCLKYFSSTHCISLEFCTTWFVLNALLSLCSCSFFWTFSERLLILRVHTVQSAQYSWVCPLSLYQRDSLFGDQHLESSLDGWALLYEILWLLQSQESQELKKEKRVHSVSGMEVWQSSILKGKKRSHSELRGWDWMLCNREFVFLLVASSVSLCHVPCSQWTRITLIFCPLSLLPKAVFLVFLSPNLSYSWTAVTYIWKQISLTTKEFISGQIRYQSMCFPESKIIENLLI